MLIDCAPVLECLTEIWGSNKFTCSGYGGDFVLPVRCRPLAAASMLAAFAICDVIRIRFSCNGDCVSCVCAYVCISKKCVCVQTMMQGAVEYQGMHRDGGVEIKTADGPSVALHYTLVSVACSLGFTSFWSGGTIDTRNLSPHFIVVNYPMVVKPGEPTGHTKHNGVTRFVKGTQNTFEPTPTLSEVRSTRCAVLNVFHLVTPLQQVL